MFGVAAVYGDGPIPMAAMRRLLALRNLAIAWESKNASEDWGKWIEDHPDGEALIQRSIVLAEREGSLIHDSEKEPSKDS